MFHLMFSVDMSCSSWDFFIIPARGQVAMNVTRMGLFFCKDKSVGQLSKIFIKNLGQKALSETIRWCDIVKYRRAVIKVVLHLTVKSVYECVWQKTCEVLAVDEDNEHVIDMWLTCDWHVIDSLPGPYSHSWRSWKQRVIKPLEDLSWEETGCRNWCHQECWWKWGCFLFGTKSRDHERGKEDALMDGLAKSDFALTDKACDVDEREEWK